MKASRPSLDIYSLNKSSLLTLEPDVEVEEAEDVSDEVLLNKEELKRPKLSLPCDRPPCEARRAKANEYELLIRNMVRIRATNDLSEDISQRNRHVSHLVGSDRNKRVGHLKQHPLHTPLMTPLRTDPVCGTFVCQQND